MAPSKFYDFDLIEADDELETVKKKILLKKQKRKRERERVNEGLFFTF